MVTFLEIATYVEGAISILLGIFLAWRGFRNLTAWLAALVIGSFGVSVFLYAARDAGAFAIFRYDGEEITLFWLGLAATADLTFALLYPSYRPVGWRGRFVGLAAFPALAGGLLFAASLAGVDAAAEVLLRAAVLSRDFLPMLSLVPLAFGFFAARTPALRNQFLYALLAFLVWGLNHAVPGLGGHPVFRLQAFVAATVQSALLLTVAGLATWQASRRPERRRQSLAILAWMLLVFPLTFLQFIDSDLHLLVDGLTVVVLFYGIARYQIVHVDLRLHSLTARGVFAAFALPLFFISQQAVEAAAGRTLGVVGATIVTGLALFLLHFGEAKIRSTKVPRDLASYEAFRRVEIYHAALEGANADGVLDRAESRTLAALRAKLRITEAEHHAIVRDLRAASRHQTE